MSSGTAQVEAGATIAPEQSSTTPPAVAAPTQHAAPIPGCANTSIYSVLTL